MTNPMLNPVAHELVGALRFIGMRDRLRCPGCRKVGTWKPHGTFWDRWREGDRPVRRWLCKWCGLYVGPEGELYAFPSMETGAWALPGWTENGRAVVGDDALPVDKVPSEVVFAHYQRHVNPWAG